MWCCFHRMMKVMFRNSFKFKYHVKEKDELKTSLLLSFLPRSYMYKNVSTCNSAHLHKWTSSLTINQKEEVIDCGIIRGHGGPTDEHISHLSAWVHWVVCLWALTQQGQFMCRRTKDSCTKCSCDNNTFLSRLVQLTWYRQTGLSIWFGSPL